MPGGLDRVPERAAAAGDGAVPRGDPAGVRAAPGDQPGDADRHQGVADRLGGPGAAGLRVRAAARPGAVRGRAARRGSAAAGAPRSWPPPPSTACSASGTIPHALVQLFEDERSAFAAVAETFNRYTLLLDTYDVHRAIHTAVEVARRVPREPRPRPGGRAAGQRRPAGATAATSARCWTRPACAECRILGSGDLDEYSIADLLAPGRAVRRLRRRDQHRRRGRLGRARRRGRRRSAASTRTWRTSTSAARRSRR